MELRSFALDMFCAELAGAGGDRDQSDRKLYRHNGGERREGAAGGTLRAALRRRGQLRL